MPCLVSSCFDVLSVHFTEALSLMVLFSGRGYWQELVESLIWVHCQLQVLHLLLAQTWRHFLGGGIIWCLRSSQRHSASPWIERLASSIFLVAALECPVQSWLAFGSLALSFEPTFGQADARFKSMALCFTGHFEPTMAAFG